MVALDSLHNNFKITTALFFYYSNNDFEKIQQIVIFTEVKNLAKQVVEATVDLNIIAKKKQFQRSKFRQNKKYFNYKKKSQYTKDCCGSISNKKRSKSQQRKQNVSDKSRIKIKPLLPNQALIKTILTTNLTHPVESS